MLRVIAVVAEASSPGRVATMFSLLLMGMLIGVAHAEPRTTQDGVYSKAQAKQGSKIYKEQCQVCHDKKYFRPVLKRWSGQSAAILYDVMSGSMPESNPGGLPADQYVDLLAYIFSQSRYPAGEEPLDSSALAEITIQEP